MSFTDCVIIHGQRSKNRDVGFPVAATQPGRYLAAQAYISATEKSGITNRKYHVHDQEKICEASNTQQGMFGELPVKCTSFESRYFELCTNVCTHVNVNDCRLSNVRIM
jgi:hypothetical protein